MKSQARMKSGFYCPSCKADQGSAEALKSHFLAAHSNPSKSRGSQSYLQHVQQQRNRGFVQFMCICKRGVDIPSLPTEILTLIHAFQLDYDYTKYAALRAPLDFARDNWNKKKAAESMLVWQKEPIRRSLLDLGLHAAQRGSMSDAPACERLVDLGKDPFVDKLAIRMHKQILDFMTDRPRTPTLLPKQVAQMLLKTTLRMPKLVNELFMQLMKQLTDNRDTESTLRGWQLFCLCATYLTPSPEFLPFAVAFSQQVLPPPYSAFAAYMLETRGRMAAMRMAQPDKKGTDGVDANETDPATVRCLQDLVGLQHPDVLSGAEGGMPSELMVEAFMLRPPILARVVLSDGSIAAEKVPILPNETVSDVTKRLSVFWGLQMESEEEGATTFDPGAMQAVRSNVGPGCVQWQDVIVPLDSSAPTDEHSSSGGSSSGSSSGGSSSSSSSTASSSSSPSSSPSSSSSLASLDSWTRKALLAADCSCDKGLWWTTNRKKLLQCAFSESYSYGLTQHQSGVGLDELWKERGVEGPLDRIHAASRQRVCMPPPLAPLQPETFVGDNFVHAPEVLMRTFGNKQMAELLEDLRPPRLVFVQRFTTCRGWWQGGMRGRLEYMQMVRAFRSGDLVTEQSCFTNEVPALRDQFKRQMVRWRMRRQRLRKLHRRMLRRKPTGTPRTVHGGWGAELEKKKPGLDLDPPLPPEHPANCRYPAYENGAIAPVPHNMEPREVQLEAERKVEEAEEALLRPEEEEEEGGDDWPTDMTCFIVACTLIVELGGELMLPMRICQ
jgi:hypothetical protein